MKRSEIDAASYDYIYKILEGEWAKGVLAHTAMARELSRDDFKAGVLWALEQVWERFKVSGANANKWVVFNICTIEEDK